MRIDPSELDPVDLYRLMISVVVPRPIAWVSTVSANGVRNAAPFSYFQALSSRPPMVMIAVGKRRGGAFKDTRRNIEETGEFVVNIVSEPSGPRMVQTSTGFEPHEDEFEMVGIGTVPSETVKPPRIAECAVSLECRLDRVLEVGSSGVCIGEIALFHVRDDVLNEDRTVDPARLRPLGRLGGNNYMPLRDVVEITQQGETTTVHSELLETWRELRRASGAEADAPPADLLQAIRDEARRLAGRDR